MYHTKTYISQIDQTKQNYSGYAVIIMGLQGSSCSL